MRWPIGLGAALLASAPALAQQEPAPPPATQDERRPLFEIGIAGGGGWRPDYPASDQNHVSGLVSPYLILRTELLRSDESGLRTPAFRGDWGELTLSASGAFPSRSEDNRAREGMPDIDWLGEVGPSLRLHLWRDEARTRRINLELPVRAVFSTDLTNIRYRGLTFSPEVAYEQRNLFRRGGRLRLALGPIFATERLHDYFYEVESRFARADRPPYDGRGGYLGTRFQFSYRLPITERLSAVAGGRLEAFSGGANRDSPLFRQDVNLTLAAGFSWSLYRSETQVSVAADPFD